jgi:hypothetical protein
MIALLRRLGRPLALTAVVALCTAPLVAAPLAHARVGVVVGFGVAPPVYYPPPVYYAPPPPVAYAPAPPPVAYAPPPPPVAYAPAPPAVTYVPSAKSCYAGPVVCPMTVPIRAGGTCWCPDFAGGRVYGTAS